MSAEHISYFWSVALMRSLRFPLKYHIDNGDAQLLISKNSVYTKLTTPSSPSMFRTTGVVAGVSHSINTNLLDLGVVVAAHLVGRGPSICQ